jgi:predicted dehydrogenase
MAGYDHFNGFASDDSRRAFLAKAAAVAGTTIFFGGKTYAAQGQPVPSAGMLAKLGKDEPIKMGLIGTGGMGTGHCDSILGLIKKGEANVQIVALADVCQPRLEDARKKCAEGQKGITVDTYTDHRKLLARPDLHGVLIASPEHWHSQHAIDAILAGKDVYCEKPMTLNLPMAMALREVCLKNPQVIFQFGTQYVNYQRYIEAKKVIEAGTIGKAVSSQTSYCRNSKDGEWLYYGIDPKWEPGKNLDWEEWCKPLGKAPWDPEIYARWRRYRKYSTGIIGDLLVHWMTPMMMALNQGWPTRVIANGGHYVDKKMENHDTVLLAAEFEKEHTMLVTGATTNETGLETMIRGHKGNIYLNSRHCVVRPEPQFDKEVEPQTIECPDIGDPQDKHRLAWFNSIRTRELPRANIELGTMVMVIVDLATRGMWDGHAYSFDHKSMTATRI